MLRIAPSMTLLALAALPAPSRAQEPAGPTVTVTARKAEVVKKLDKTVYDVANTARAANGSAQDVLQSTPEVSVTADGHIAVKGNTQVTVLVDGKPTAVMSGDERAVALQTMSGADIASVEVITNPSAAYNANGGAIVNIVLKRNRRPGKHAQIQGSATDQGLWNVGASGDLTRRDLSVHGSLALRHDGNLKIRESAVDWNNPLGGQSGHTVQSSRVFVRRVVQSAALGADYALSDVDSLSLGARYNERRSRPLFDVLNTVDQSVYHRISVGPNEQADHSASLSYSHQDRDAALKAMVQRSATTGLVDKSYRDVFVEPARATGTSRGATRLARHLDQATLDWTSKGDAGQWGMGLDLQDKLDGIDNYQAAVDPLSGAELPDPTTTNGYAVETSVHALYLTDQVTRGPWEMLLGARAERMRLRVRPGGAGVSMLDTGHWQALNPSLHLKYAASEQADLTLGFRRSLQMPDPRDLNPFTTYIDAQNLSRGNPGLRPQRLTSWELGANAERDRLSASAGAFYRTSRDTVLDARSFADSVLVTSKQNGGQARSGGVTGSLDWKPDPKLQFGVDGGVYRVLLDTPDLSGVVNIVVRQDAVAGYLNIKAAYRVDGDDLVLDAHGQSAGITPLGRFGATSSVNLSWKHAFSKTLSLTVNANDLFDGSSRNYATAASTFRQVGVDHFVARRVYVGFVKKID